MALTTTTPTVKPKYPAADEDEVDAYRSGFTTTTAPSSTGVPAPTTSTAPAATGVPAPTAPAPAAAPTAPAAPAPTPAPAPTVGSASAAATAPSTGGIDPAPATLDPNAAWGQASTAFQSRHGRAMTAAEQQQLIAAVNFTGGPVTQAQMDQALSLINGYNPGAAPGAPPAAAPTPAAPTGTIDPNKAIADVTAAFKARLGRPPNPGEIDWLISQAGYTGGQVTQAQLDLAMNSVSRYTGNPGRPFNTPTPAGPVESEADERLLELLNQEWGEVDTNSPAMRAQRDAFGLQSQRETTRRRAAAAERAAQEGTLNSGGFDVETDQILADEGERGQAFEAQMVSKELEGQRARLMQAIALAKQSGLQEKAQDLQEELALLEIDLKRMQTRGQLSLGLLGLQQGNTHFYDDLGARLLGMQNQADTEAFRSMWGL